MMKNLIPLLLILISFTSCKLTDGKSLEEESEVLEASVKDSITVSDKDEHGCLASAGYIWSKVNKECVKGFSGIQLNPIDLQTNEDETKSAYVLFSEDVNQAEIFLPNQENSMVLTRKSEGQPWIYQDWQLIPWKGYVLKQGDKNLFAGDGEIGHKVLGSDTEQ
jgi:hypothetical protein